MGWTAPRSNTAQKDRKKQANFVAINMINVETTVLPSASCMAALAMTTQTDDKFDRVDEPRALEETKRRGRVCPSIHPSCRFSEALKKL